MNRFVKDNSNMLIVVIQQIYVSIGVKWPNPLTFWQIAQLFLVGLFIDCVKFTSLQRSLWIFAQYFLRPIANLFAQSNFSRLEFSEYLNRQLILKKYSRWRQYLVSFDIVPPFRPKIFFHFPKERAKKIFLYTITGKPSSLHCEPEIQHIKNRTTNEQNS